MKLVSCPLCDANVSGTYDPIPGGVSGTWYCDNCDLVICESEVNKDAE